MHQDKYQDKYKEVVKEKNEQHMNEAFRPDSLSPENEKLLINWLLKENKFGKTELQAAFGDQITGQTAKELAKDIADMSGIYDDAEQVYDKYEEVITKVGEFDFPTVIDQLLERGMDEVKGTIYNQSLHGGISNLVKKNMKYAALVANAAGIGTLTKGGIKKHINFRPTDSKVEIGYRRELVGSISEDKLNQYGLSIDGLIDFLEKYDAKQV